MTDVIFVTPQAITHSRVVVASRVITTQPMTVATGHLSHCICIWAIAVNVSELGLGRAPKLWAGGSKTCRLAMGGCVKGLGWGLAPNPWAGGAKRVGLGAGLAMGGWEQGQGLGLAPKLSAGGAKTCRVGAGLAIGDVPRAFRGRSVPRAFRGRSVPRVFRVVVVLL